MRIALTVNESTLIAAEYEPGIGLYISLSLFEIQIEMYPDGLIPLAAETLCVSLCIWARGGWLSLIHVQF